MINKKISERNQMIKKIKISILFLMTFMFLQTSYGQVQRSMTDYLKEKFLSYNEAVPWKDIFIHTDREDYIAGENLWFEVYLIDRQNNKPAGSDKILYLELLTPENIPVIQKRISVNKGFGIRTDNNTRYYEFGWLYFKSLYKLDEKFSSL